MLYFFKRLFIIFCLVIILFIQICYADNFDIRVIDFNNNFNEATINFNEATNNFYNYNDYVFEDIKGCSLQNHLINKKISKFKNMLIFFKFFFSSA
jgi:hypothetical protein